MKMTESVEVFFSLFIIFIYQKSINGDFQPKKPLLPLYENEADHLVSVLLGAK